MNKDKMRERVSKQMNALWKDPKFRANIIPKQRALGYRNYPDY